MRSGEVEGLLSLSSCDQQLLPHDLHAGVVGQLQVVNTGHDRGQEVIWVLSHLERFAYYGQRRIEASESWDTKREQERHLNPNWQGTLLAQLAGNSIQFLNFYTEVKMTDLT